MEGNMDLCRKIGRERRDLHLLQEEEWGEGLLVARSQGSAAGCGGMDKENVALE